MTVARAGSAPGMHPAVLFACLLALTLLSFFRFPGHTILQSDTQIYIPILEHVWDPSTYTRDIMATRPHISFTLYDEMAIALRTVTRASFEHVLMGQQFVYRFIGVCGLYFLVVALGLGSWKAMFVAAILSLGATINGPAVLLIEYEPVPRGFALPFVIASMAAAAHGRWKAAAACATIGFGFHPPTGLAYCALLGVVLLSRRKFREIGILAIGPVLMLLTIGIGGLPAERQPIFGRLDPELETLQRMRAAYNWVSVWLNTWKYHYALMWLAALFGLWRMRDRISKPLMVFFAGLVLIGVLSVPLSYLLLEQSKWMMVSQFQPGRYLLFVTFVAMLLCSTAAIVAAGHRRWWEAVPLFTLVFAIPMDPRVTNVLAPDNQISIIRLTLAIGLAALATFFVASRRPSLSSFGVMAAAVLPFLVIPWIGQVRNYAALHHSELNELAAWARQNTPKEALFQFDNFDRDLVPGVFRARSTRALYVDWKAGGQVNFLKDFATTWSQRWNSIQKPLTLDAYRSMGIDYVVFKAGSAPAESQPVYRNSKYVVIKLS